MLDEIANPRLFRLKQRTLLWRFSIIHAPGKSNFFSDATSRNPAQSDNDSDERVTTTSMALGSIRHHNCEDDAMEAELSQISANNLYDFRAITWEIVKHATSKDDACLTSPHPPIKMAFPPTQAAMPANISDFWKQRDKLHVVDDVVMMGNRVLIPKSLRAEVLESLHAAYQGATAMKDRARCSVYWPGITKDIETACDSCFQCNRCAPSQAKLPPFEPHIPTTPFMRLLFLQSTSLLCVG